MKLAMSKSASTRRITQRTKYSQLLVIGWPALAAIPSLPLTSGWAMWDIHMDVTKLQRQYVPVFSKFLLTVIKVPWTYVDRYHNYL